jgi:hypothetical protein
VLSHRFSLGVVDELALRGVAIVGRPVARLLDDGLSVEVTRLCTDGTPNAASALYGGVRRTARAMGFRRILTYVLATEPGTSLRAAGVAASFPAASVRGAAWARPAVGAMRLGPSICRLWAEQGIRRHAGGRIITRLA